MPRFTGIDKSGRNVGEIIKLGQSTLPYGFVACDGSSQSTTTYAALFAVIGYTYGGSGGSFNLPDFKGRSAVGDGAGSGLTARTLGQTLGTETHQIASGNLPTHTHSSGSFTAAGQTSSDSSGGVVDGGIGSHTHTDPVLFGAVNFTTGATSLWRGGGSYPGGTANGTSVGGNSPSSVAHTHSIAHTHSSSSVSGTSGDGGFANSSINHMNPVTVVRYAIAYI